mgnify:CR=1 FL=1
MKLSDLTNAYSTVPQECHAVLVATTESLHEREEGRSRWKGITSCESQHRSIKNGQLHLISRLMSERKWRYCALKSDDRGIRDAMDRRLSTLDASTGRRERIRQRIDREGRSVEREKKVVGRMLIALGLLVVVGFVLLLILSR